MGDVTGIAWTDHTFNPWIGCTAVSPACDHCYAETLAKRYGWDFAARRRTRPENWNKPLRWNRDAERDGAHRRVFCASLADVFDNRVPDEWRADLWALIRKCPSLNWQLLTKRPQNIARMLPPDWGEGWHNVWLGTTAENQAEADRRIPHLLAIPSSIRFLSCEPLLGPIQFARVPGFNRIDLSFRNWWVIVGGESGPSARVMEPAWAVGIIDQCRNARVPVFMKQVGSIHTGWPNGITGKGDTPDEWPAWARKQGFPNA